MSTEHSRTYRARKMAEDPEGFKAHRSALNKAYRAKNRDKLLARERSRSKEQKLLYGAKERAKQYGVPFNIDASDIVIPEFCPALGVKLVHGKGKICANSPTLDRRVPELGYVKGNVAVISQKANTIKSNATAEEVESVLNWMRK